MFRYRIMGHVGSLIALRGVVLGVDGSPQRSHVRGARFNLPVVGVRIDVSERGRSEAAERSFGVMLAAAIALGAALRLTYVLTDRRANVGGDGFDYHVSAGHLADGLGYTGWNGEQTAHHPPGWVTVLGVVSWLGGRSERAHELVGVAIGIGVIALAGFIGRRYFGARIGIIAAVLAALYPGFWVLEGNINSEPLGLLVFGLLALAVAGLRRRPTLGRSLGVGALCGLLALVRSEQLLLLFIVVVPVLIRARDLTRQRRTTLVLLAVLACGVVIAPWCVYNQTRFKKPVFLSTNGATALAGNCAPASYAGEDLGYYDTSCNYVLAAKHPDMDRSQLDALARSTALHNISHNITKLPIVVPARFGRLLAVFRPSQTVGWVASWMKTDRRPIWAWVASYWILIPLAIIGTVAARRSGAFLLPLVGPVVIVIVSVAILYGEPRYHTPSDLGVVVLAAAGIDQLVLARSARSADERTTAGS